MVIDYFLDGNTYELIYLKFPDLVPVNIIKNHVAKLLYNKITGSMLRPFPKNAIKK